MTDRMHPPRPDRRVLIEDVWKDEQTSTEKSSRWDLFMKSAEIIQKCGLTPELQIESNRAKLYAARRKKIHLREDSE